MKKHFVIADSITGLIHVSGSGNEDGASAINFPASFSVPNPVIVSLDNSLTRTSDYYYDGSGIVARLANPATQDTDTISADGLEKSSISNVVIGSEVFIDDVSQGTTPDGLVELTFDTVGIYRIRLSLFSYLDAEFTVNAN